MAPAPLEPALVDFIVAHLDTIDTLEVLLLLAASQERRWTPDSVAAERRTSSFAASQRLTQLTDVGLVDSNAEGFAFHPPSEESRALVSALAEAYRERRTTVTAAIYARKAQANQALRSFSDAFRLKKDED